MAITATAYGVLLTDLGAGVHNFATDTDKVALLTSAYTPNLTAHTTLSDITNQISGGDYVAGGGTLTGKTWTVNGAGKIATLSAATLGWTNLTATARYAVVYKSTGTASTSKLISVIDFGADRTFSAEPFQLSFPSGVLTITAP